MFASLTRISLAQRGCPPPSAVIRQYVPLVWSARLLSDDKALQQSVKSQNLRHSGVNGLTNRPKQAEIVSQLFAAIKKGSAEEVWQKYTEVKDAKLLGSGLDAGGMVMVFRGLRSRNVDAAKLVDLLKDMNATGGEVRCTILSDLLDHAAKQSNVGVASSTFLELQHQHLLRPYDYRSMMTLHRNFREYDLVQKYFEQAVEAFGTEKCHTFKRFAAEAYARSGNIEAATRLLREYIETETNESRIKSCYDEWLTHLVRAQKWSDADKVLKEMEMKNIPKKLGIYKFAVDVHSGKLKDPIKSLEAEIDSFDFNQSAIREPFRDQVLVLVDAYISRNDVRNLHDVLSHYVSVAPRFAGNTKTRLSFDPFIYAFEYHFKRNEIDAVKKLFDMLPPSKFNYRPIMNFLIKNFERVGDSKSVMLLNRVSATPQFRFKFSLSRENAGLKRQKLTEKTHALVDGLKVENTVSEQTVNSDAPEKGESIALGEKKLEVEKKPEKENPETGASAVVPERKKLDVKDSKTTTNAMPHEKKVENQVDDKKNFEAKAKNDLGTNEEMIKGGEIPKANSPAKIEAKEVERKQEMTDFSAEGIEKSQVVNDAVKVKLETPPTTTEVKPKP